MKIGIFTDTYRPAVNGVVYVTETLRRTFEAAGHEVYIFAPAANLSSKSDDDHIIRFPAVKSMVTGEDNLSLFFPPAVLKQIKELNLDMLHFLTPLQVGLMAIYAGKKENVDYHLSLTDDPWYQMVSVSLAPVRLTLNGRGISNVQRLETRIERDAELDQ